MKRLLIVLSLALAPGFSAAQEQPEASPSAPSPQTPGTAVPVQTSRPAKGYVLQVEGKLVYLDLGLRDNVRVGDTFEIIRDQDIVHPITGESLGGKATVGVVKVVQVFEKLSVAEIVSVIPGATMTRLDRVRMGNEPLEPPPPPPPAEATPPSAPPTEAKAHEGELVRNPDGVVGGIDLGLGGGYETKQKMRLMGADLLFPLSRRFTVGGDISSSRESHGDSTLKVSDSEREIGGMVRIYLGRWLRGGEDMNPDGDVGSIVLDIGGGTRSLKATTDSSIVSTDNTQTPPVITRRDSVIARETASQNGFSFGLLLPLARRWTFGAGYEWGKDLGRASGLIRYYTSAIDPDWAGANPDGKTGSFVVTLFGSYDSKGVTSKKWMGFDLKVPLSSMFTFGLTYDTNQKLHRVRGGINIHVEKRLLR